MGPKKKGKKGYGNSGRGVATVSVPSKAKVVDEIESNAFDTPAATTLEVTSNGQLDSQSKAENIVKAPQNSQQLTPDQFEQQLKEDENRLLVEKYSEHVWREASRHAARLKTDRRVFRGQAEPINPRYWLSDELVSDIWDQIKLDLMHEKQVGSSSTLLNEQRSNVVHDEYLIRLWQLKKTLINLDFQEQDSKLALTALVQTAQASRDDRVKRSTPTGLEMQQCLTWLGLNCPPDRLPDYFTHQNAVINQLREEEEKRQILALQGESDDLVSKNEQDIQKDRKGEHTAEDARTESSSDDDRSSGDEEYDPDNPDHLTKRYLKLMARLHRQRPDLTTVYDGKQRKKKQTQIRTSSQMESPRVKRLLTRLKQLESDLLFDADAAQMRWASQRQSIELDGELQKRGHKSKQNNLASSSEDQASIANSSNHNMDDEGDALAGIGDLLDSLQDENVSNGSTVDHKQTSAHAQSSVGVLRDFGKWSGLSPRRVLEEVCKARDSSAKIIFRFLGYGHQKSHSVEVHWSSPQDIRPDCPTDLVSVVFTRSFARFSMTGISTPEDAQSEAYIATLGLFGLFNSSPKEEKAYLRLPSVWRNLYAELRDSSKTKQLDEDALEVETIRALAETDDSVVEQTSSMSPIAQNEVLPSKPVEIKSEQAESAPASRPDTQAVKQIWASKSATKAFQEMERGRQMLPMWSFKSQLLSAVENSQIVIVCGETGCGKSTQTPSFILERELSLGRDCRIYCTEPRRISAISLARRVSEELGEGRNDLGTRRSLVGYSIRLESRINSETRLVYATTGVVMRLLERDADLTEVTHLILDEVHERTIDSDFLLIILRRLTVRRPNLKVILMSATVNAERFSQYLHGAPVLNVPGRTFPVKVNFLEDALETVGAGSVASKNDTREEASAADDLSEIEDDSDRQAEGAAADTLSAYSIGTRNALKEYNEYRINYDLIVRLLDSIYTNPEYEEFSRATLVFLPGINEIRRLNDMLSGHKRFTKGCQVFSLHSTIAMEEQERAFRIPPPGVRKIVLATNIAETGITIPDITCVIDSGTHKEMRFDERRQLSRLIEAFISRANAKQRRGRAGRVQNGLCFHLFTRTRHDCLMAEQQTPEIMRLSLQDIVLRIKICHLGSIEGTLSEALDAPLGKNVRRAVDYLIDVKALTQGEQLTLLGRQLAKLPLDVFLGKLILLGSVFKCLDSCLSFAAILSSKSPFAAPMASRALADHARLSFKKGDSDLLTIYNAYSGWRRVCKTQGASETDFCRRNYLSSQTLANIEEVKGQLTGALVEAGFLERDDRLLSSLGKVKSHSRQRHFVELPIEATSNDGRDGVVDSVIAWAFYPKLMQRDGKGWRNVTTNQSIALHPSSVNKRDFTGRFLSFYHLMQSAGKAYNAHETSAVDDFAITLSCGDADFQLYAGVVSLDSNRIRFAMPSWKSMITLMYLRSNLLGILEDIYKRPSRQLSERQQRWFNLLQRCFEHRCDS